LRLAFYLNSNRVTVLDTRSRSIERQRSKRRLGVSPKALFAHVRLGGAHFSFILTSPFGQETQNDNKETASKVGHPSLGRTVVYRR
jgi:hypothetical protein